jgi:hypothetical protein
MDLMPRSTAATVNSGSLPSNSPQGFDGIGFLGADLVVEAHALDLRSGLDLVEHGVDGAQLAVTVEQRVA